MEDKDKMEQEYRALIKFSHEDEIPLEIERNLSCENDFFLFLNEFNVPPDSHMNYENKENEFVPFDRNYDNKFLYDSIRISIEIKDYKPFSKIDLKLKDIDLKLKDKEIEFLKKLPLLMEEEKKKEEPPDFPDFRSIFMMGYSQQQAIVSVREQKCKETFEFLEIFKIVLIKSPPASGKSFFGKLFEAYLRTTKKSKCNGIFIINANEVSDVDDLFNLIFSKTPYKDVHSLYEGIPGVRYYFIIDEAQNLYNETYNPFWNFVKECCDGVRNNNIFVMSLAVYSERKAYTSSSISTIYFKDKTKGLEFMRFDNAEIDEIIRNYEKCHKFSKEVPIQNELKKIIMKETNCHPDLVMKTIEFLAGNSVNTKKDDRTHCYYYELIYSQDYLNTVVHASKCSPNRIKFDKSERDLIEKIYFHRGVIFDELSENYRIAKNLEKIGIIYEDMKSHSFDFVSNSLKSDIFLFFFQESVPIITNETYKQWNKVSIAVEAIKRFKRNHLLPVLEERKKSKLAISENQWSIEFVSALYSMIDASTFRIYNQSSKEIHKDFKGLLDIFIDSKIKVAYEVTREGCDVVNHVLRKYKAEHPQLKFPPGVKGKYKFRPNTQYLVIDFTQKEFQKDKVTSVVVDGKDLTNEVQRDLMRVIYNEKMTTFTIYYQEQFYVLLEFDEKTNNYRQMI